MVPTITDNCIGPRSLTRCADSVASDMQHVAETSGLFGSRRKIVFSETHRGGHIAFCSQGVFFSSACVQLVRIPLSAGRRLEHVLQILV